ncbi:MAG: class II aldolase/adducin family protein [Cyanobacteria bacterium REEB67]|nr:class II aldolase/adducin family protein [Cyanobacteria bacterium REEB67]
MITLNEEQARKDLVDVARLSYSRDYICGTEGNFSVRLDAETLLTTPRGVCKGSLTVSDLVVTNLDGHLTANGQMTSRLPSTELPMHLAVYRLRPDVRAVVHAHPTTAVAFTVAGKSLTRCLLPEAILALGNIPVAPYATPSTQEVPDSIEACVRENNVVMLDHHGALCYADTIWDAFYLLETLEHHAKTFLIAELLGGAKPLQKGAVEKLFDICSIYGMKVPANSAELLKGDRVSHNSTFINPVTNKSAPANSNHTSMQGSNSGLLKDKIDNLKNKLDTMKNG